MRFGLAVLTLATAASLCAQNPKPNFTGKYELDRSASQLAGERRPGLRALIVEHSEPMLKFTYQERNRAEEFNLTTDGLDQVRDQPKGESRMSARWDGNVLELRSYRKMEEGEITTVERWSLGQDGVLTIQTRASRKSSRQGTSSPERESKLVFRKKA